MFTWMVRIALFCFMGWTMSIPNTECYISPPIWAFFIFLYWFCNHPMHTPKHLR